MSHSIQPGVLTNKFKKFFNSQKIKSLLPAVNVIGSSSINGVLETAASLNAPVIVQFSNGGAQLTRAKDFPTKTNRQPLLELCRRKTRTSIG